jgi:hypothetical protein
MNTEQKSQLSEYFNELGLYGAVCLKQNEIFEKSYSHNVIELVMDSDSIFHKETVMKKNDVFLKKDELYKLVFPVPLPNLECFTIVVSSHNKNCIICYENTLNSLLIKSNIDLSLPSIGLWTHQNNGVIYL